MAENKFIQRLKGETTSAAVLEVKNQATPASFGNMPAGTSNHNSVYSDHRGNATAVLNGTDIWTVNDDALALASNVYGDGRDFTTSHLVVGSGAWVNATYTFAEPKIFTKNSKWVLKLCGTGLIVDGAQTVDFSLVVKVGASNIFTKQFTVAEDAGTFCKEFVLDFAETNADTIKLAAGDTLTVQLLCGAETATARVYNGMTALTCLQRRVGAEAVASDTDTFEDIAQSVADVEQSVADMEETIAGLGDTYVKKVGDTMTGALRFESNVDHGAIFGFGRGIELCGIDTSGNTFPIVSATTLSFSAQKSGLKLGNTTYPWAVTYTKTINNGYELIVPQKAGTLATIEDVNAALANAGSSLTSKGVWYAKMDAGTTPPAAEDGTNYADFSQTDGQGNPIIAIYERQNGAWVQTETITPPANYNGYVIVTSKIWDIPEQTGQQGGQVNWDCVHKTFTPYPKIVSFEDAALTGDSTVQMPVSPTNDSITNKGYVDTAIANAVAAVSPWDLFDIKWKDYTFSGIGWALSDGNWKTSATAYTHLSDDFAALPVSTVYCTSFPNIVKTFYRDPVEDVVGAAHPYAYTSFRSDVIETIYGDTDTAVFGQTYYTTATGSTVFATNGAHTYWDVPTPEVETVAGIKISFYRTADGHKIITPDQIGHADAIYAATGIAWYYVLDTENQQFKLPRTQYAFVNMRTAVGAYVEPSAPNISGVANSIIITGSGATATGALSYTNKTNANLDNTSGTGENYAKLNLNAASSSSVYKNGATIQQAATEMYLYFYVGV